MTIDMAKGHCASCKNAFDVFDNTEHFHWAYCRRFPPKNKGVFPKVDPYYTTCGEYCDKHGIEG